MKDDPLTAKDRAVVRRHEARMAALPDYVKEAWAEYCAKPDRYPYGFAVHFPEAWNWRKSDGGEQSS